MNAPAKPNAPPIYIRPSTPKFKLPLCCFRITEIEIINEEELKEWKHSKDTLSIKEEHCYEIIEKIGGTNENKN